MFAGLPPWQRYLPLPILPPSTLSPPHPTCLLSQPPAPLLVPVSTLVRLLHTTSLHIAQLPIQHWIQRILEEHIQKLHSWQQQPPPHPWQFENMFVWCLERDSNSSSQGARGKPLFRCASISWFQAVSGSVGNLPFSASASTGLSDYFIRNCKFWSFSSTQAPHQQWHYWRTIMLTHPCAQ